MTTTEGMRHKPPGELHSIMAYYMYMYNCIHVHVCVYVISKVIDS